MRLRRPCKHNRYEAHEIHFDVWGEFDRCPGGEFLPEDALVIEKVEGEWPNWTEPVALYIVQILDRLAVLNPFADQVGEPA